MAGATTIIGVDLNEDNTGYLTYNGKVDITWQEDKQGVIEITPQQAFILNEYQNIELAKTSGSFFHASQNTPPSLSWMLDHMTTLNGVGNGFGADIGFVYEKRGSFR